MTDAALIRAVSLYWLQIGGQETADDEENKERIAFHATQAVAEFWSRPWHWRDTSGTATIDNTGVGPLPDDFGSFSRGFVADSVTGTKLIYKDPQTLFRMRESSSGFGDPLYYTIAGSDASADPMVKAIHTVPKPSANRDLTVYYEKKRPIVTDGGEGLQSVPEEYHHDVIYLGTIAKLADAEGDARAPKYDADFNRAIGRAWSESRMGLQVAKRNRGYGSRRWY